MRYQPKIDRQEYSFEVPPSDLSSILRIEETTSLRLLESYAFLSDFLDKLPGLSRAEYGNDLSGAVSVSVETDGDDDLLAQRLAAADLAIGNFMDDARRFARYFPDFLDYNAKNTQGAPFELLYTDEDFVILGASSRQFDVVSVLVGHAGGTNYLSQADDVLYKIFSDRINRSLAVEDFVELPFTPSRDLKEVRKWISKFVDLPELLSPPTVSIEDHCGPSLTSPPFSR